MPGLSGLRQGVRPGTQAAIKTGFPRGGLGAQARRAAGQVRTIADLRPGFMTERIESSPQRALLLNEVFGPKLGGLLENSSDRFNLVRQQLESRERAKRVRRRGRAQARRPKGKARLLTARR